MTDPIATLVKLNNITVELNEIQSWIDHARQAAPTNQVVQLNLDRQQATVDERRSLVEAVKRDIASRN